MSRYQKYFIGVILLTIAAVAVNLAMPIIPGLDIAGGVRVVLQVDPKRPADWPADARERSEKMDAIRKTITNRVKGIGGVTEPVVVVQNPTAPLPRLVVELPGVADRKTALRRIRRSASLEFYHLKDVQSDNNQLARWRMDPPDTEDKPFIFTGPQGETIDSIKQPEAVLEQVVNTKDNPPIVTGKDLMSNARANLTQGKVVVEIQFNEQGTAKFRDFTRRNVGEYLAVFYEGRLLTAPVIKVAILDGKAVIEGFRSLKEAKGIADYLNSGALPVPLKVVALNSVEPTLGKETVQQVIKAGILGLILVVLFMALYYRLPGVLADIALVLYAIFVLAAFRIFGATMSLGGIAALIISIGMAVDANILIFERLKEELKSGKTLRAAIDAGFNRAFTAIFDSNMCTFITCAILMWYGGLSGTPTVSSFALTLFVGVLISMFTAITVTRTMLHLLVSWEWAQKPGLYGLSTGRIAESKLDIVGKRRWWFALSACLIIPGLVVLYTDGLKKGIEFKSGTSIQVAFEKPVDLLGVLQTVQKHAPGSAVQLADGRTMAFITTELLRDKLGETVYEKKLGAIRDELAKNFGVRTDPETGQPAFSDSSVEPVISKELTTNAFWAVVMASIGIVLYLSVRFAIGGIAAGFKYGVCAVIALVHDSAFVLGLFAILGKLLGWEVDSLFVTAVLTIIGFSVHDTIVVYDRIRENLRHRLRGESFEQLCNRSILQTFARSINTTLTVVLTLAMLILFGGPLLRQFYIALLVGIVIGTYSSIFNATQLVVVWEGIANRTRQPRKKAFEDKPLVERASRPVVEAEPASDTQEAAVEAEAPASSEDGGKSVRIRKKTGKKRRY